MTAPSGDSPLSGPDAYAASVAQAAAAVAAAIASNDTQQGQARQWFERRLPEDPAAHEPGAADAPNL